MSIHSTFEQVADYYNRALQVTEKNKLIGRIAELEAENFRLKMSNETASDKPSEPTIYDQVIKNLNERVDGKSIVPVPVRGEIRKALDKADSPLQGREKSDDALKRITR